MTEAFAGFTAPHYTPIPDDLLDNLMADLSGSELKVLLYIMRRTLGFKRSCDTISLSQIASGIVRKDGTRLDRGTGLRRGTICDTLKSLTEKGYVRATHNERDNGSHDTTSFEIVFLIEQSHPSTKTVPPLVRKPDQGVVRKSDPQETVVQETGKQKVSNDAGAVDQKTRVSCLDSLSPEQHAEADAILALPGFERFKGKAAAEDTLAALEREYPKVDLLAEARRCATRAEEKHQPIARMTRFDSWIRNANFGLTQKPSANDAYKQQTARHLDERLITFQAEEAERRAARYAQYDAEEAAEEARLAKTG